MTWQQNARVVDALEELEHTGDDLAALSAELLETEGMTRDQGVVTVVHNLLQRLRTELSVVHGDDCEDDDGE